MSEKTALLQLELTEALTREARLRAQNEFLRATIARLRADLEDENARARHEMADEIGFACGPLPHGFQLAGL